MKHCFSVLIITLLLVSFGCSQQASEQPKAADTNSAAVTPAFSSASAPAPETKDRYTIGVVPKGLAHQFWLTVKAGTEAAGKKFNADIVWQGPAQETEIDKQISIIEDMITSRVDAIVMAACDENALVPVLKKALDCGIPVVTIDSGVKSDLPIPFVATDNVAGAKAAAKELARVLDNEGEVGVIPFVAGAATSEMREQGFKDGLADTGLTLVSTLYSQSDAAIAMNVAQDMMTANPNLKGIFAANEPGVTGAAQAIRSAGKTSQIKLVGFDASDEEVEGLKNGTVSALIVQNPFKMGYDGVRIAIDKIQKKETPERVDTGVTVVTAENLNEPEIQKLLNPLK